MKKMMMVGSALLVLSSSTFATEARLLALGMNETDNEGMYYIQDGRNIFLNPAYINLYADQAVFEYGNAGTGVPAAQARATLNQSTNAKAQGGFFKKYGDFVYGAYVGNESNTSSLLRIVGTGAASAASASAATGGHMLQTADNQIDLFFGGESSLKWAGNIIYAHGKDETISSKDTAISLRSGLMGSKWDAHLNVSLASKSSMTDTATVAAAGITNAVINEEFKGKLGFHVGGSYLLDDKNRIFGYVKHYGWEQTENFAYSGAQRTALGGQNGTVKGDFSSYYLGWGRDFDVNGTDKLFTSLAARKTDINLKFDNKGEVRQLLIPLTLGYEAKATEWLVIRGSVVQNLYGQKNNKNVSGSAGRLNGVAKATIAGLYGSNGKATIATSTAVNAGATFVFGNLTIDGLIGTTGSTGTAGSKTGVLAVDNLLTKAAVTYKF